MQSKLDALPIRVSEAEERISDLECKLMDRKEIEKNRDRQLVTHEKKLGEINDVVKHSNVRIIGISEKVERERVLEGIFEQIITENFPYSGEGNWH